MSEKTQNVPAIQKAITMLTSFKNKSMAFARQEDFESVSQQYQPLVSIVVLMPEDFTDMGHDNMYPGKSATNRIGDASGVDFLENVGGTREIGDESSVKFVKTPGGYIQLEGKYEIVGRAQGERLKPDGTPRRSSPSEYGYNVVSRTNDEILKNAQFEKPGTKDYWADNEIICRRKFNEIGKAGRQKARTGAELGVIRELVGMPTAFKKKQLAKEGPTEMLFSQVIENNTFKMQVLGEVLRTPDGRAAVVQALFGATRSVFGPQESNLIGAAPAAQIEAQPEGQPVQRTVDIQSGEMLPSAGPLFSGSENEVDFPDEKSPEQEPERMDGLKANLKILEDYKPQVDKNAKGKKVVTDALALLKTIIAKSKPTADEITAVLASSNSAIDRCYTFVQTVKEKEAAKKEKAAS